MSVFPSKSPLPSMNMTTPGLPDTLPVIGRLAARAAEANKENVRPHRAAATDARFSIGIPFLSLVMRPGGLDGRLLTQRRGRDKKMGGFARGGESRARPPLQAAASSRRACLAAVLRG